MIRTVFAIAVASLLTLAVSGTSQAAPIAPPTGPIGAADQAPIRADYYQAEWTRP